MAEKQEVAEGSVVYLKPEESTLRVGMEATIPGGDKATFDTYAYASADDKAGTLVSEGNLYYAYVIKLLLADGVGMVLDNSYNVSSNVQDGPRGYQNGNDFLSFYINPVSDRYHFADYWFMQPKDIDKGVFYTSTQAPKAVEGTYMNDPEYLYDDHYGDFDCGIEVLQRLYTINLIPYVNGQMLDFCLYSKNDDISLWKIYCSRPATLAEEGEALAYAFNRECENDIEMTTTTWGETYASQCLMMRGEPVFPFAPEGETATVFPTDGLLAGGAPDDPVVKAFPGFEPLSSLVAVNRLREGDGMPTLLFFKNQFYQWNPDTQESTYALGVDAAMEGRLGEGRICTSDFYTTHYEVGGEEINLAAQTEGYAIPPVAGATGEAKYTGIFTNGKIDGLDASNTVKMEFDTEGLNMPTMTVMQMRDLADGAVAQSFEKSADMATLVSAADFTFHSQPGADEWETITWATAEKPLEMALEYAPYGKTDFKAMRVTTDDPDFYRGLGYLYKGYVDEDLADGWYDVKVTLKGANATMQSQCVSPAFRIGDAASLDKVAADSFFRVEGSTIVVPEGASVSVYDMQGRLASKGTSLAGLASGVYAVRVSTAQGDATHKIAVR